MATKSSTKKTQDVADVQDKVNVPSAIRDDKKKSASSLLAGLAGKATKVDKKKEKERTVITLTGKVAALFSQFAPAKELADIFTARVDSLKEEINTSLFSGWVETFWRFKNLPVNPAVQAVNDEGDESEGMFIVQERFKLQIPDAKNPESSIQELLVELGLDDEKAEELVSNELNFTPTVGLRSFSELVDGTDEEKAIAQKILEFVTNELTDEEKALVLKNEAKSEVKKGFYGRVCNYVESDEQLANVFKVVVPVMQNKGAKFATNASPVDHTNKLLAFSQELLGATEEDDE